MFTAWFETTNHMFELPTMASAFYGLVHLYGLEHRFYESHILRDQNICSLDPKDNIFIGSVESIHRVLLLNGYNIPEPIDYPLALKKYLGRKMTLCSKEIFQRHWENYRNHFIKPFKHKLFDGFVFNRMPDLLALNRLRSNDELWISPAIDIQSEFRVYILNKQIRSIAHYAGDPTILPDMDIVEGMVETYKNSPIAYSLDVGVSGGTTILIEANDSFALGQYSWIPRIQAEMLLARWKEMTHESNKRSSTSEIP